ncbi:MAG: zinc-binding dehydrogenase [Pseudomonadota bacterium]
MRVIEYDRHGSIEELKLRDGDIPEPLPHEVRLRVKAVALNGFDPMMLAGSTGLSVPFPQSPCGDVAGVIDSIGGEVGDEWIAGQSVSVYPILPDVGMMGEVSLGAAREFICVPASCLISIPDNVTAVDAAALPVAYGTAYRMMVERCRLERGQRVLILGATGGVGVAAIQLALNAGAEVIACGSGEWKARRLKELGAHHVIDTSKNDFYRCCREWFGKPDYLGIRSDGVDVVVNYIGGSTVIPALRLLKRHGRMVICGATAGHDVSIDLRYLWSFEQELIGSNGWTPQDQASLLALCSSGELAPVIHAVRPLEEMPAAMRELQERQIFGKSVLTV